MTLSASGGTVSFAYDPFGRRIKKVTSSTTSIFAYDGDNLIEETNASGTAVARYEGTQNIDEPLAMLRSSATSYYHSDGLGSVTSLSNAAGALAQTYTFDSFGKQTASSGSLTNPFQYTARESDTETGLYYYRARYYDPTAGRFLNEDPISFGAGIDFYAYVKNSSLNLVDPTGSAQTPNPKLPTVPTGKAGCQFVQEVDTGGPCKNCVYKCRGYGALVVFPQAVGKPCPSIDPVSGLVRTDEIDPSCREPEKKCEPEKKKEPAPKPKKPWWYWFFWNVFVFE